jgi:secondary thiamine-phosphate synthase enzyme
LHTEIHLETPHHDSLTNITDQVRDAVKESGVVSGVCYVVVPHTTAGITINSYVDPLTACDIISDVRRLIPTRTDFQHIADTPSDAAGHIKSTLIGTSEVILIEDGDLVLGHSQGLMFYEFDGPRKRRVLVRIIPG